MENIAIWENLRKYNNDQFYQNGRKTKKHIKVFDCTYMVVA